MAREFSTAAPSTAVEAKVQAFTLEKGNSRVTEEKEAVCDTTQMLTVGRNIESRSVGEGGVSRKLGELDLHSTCATPSTPQHFDTYSTGAYSADSLLPYSRPQINARSSLEVQNYDPDVGPSNAQNVRLLANQPIFASSPPKPQGQLMYIEHHFIQMDDSMDPTELLDPREHKALSLYCISADVVKATVVSQNRARSLFYYRSGQYSCSLRSTFLTKCQGFKMLWSEPAGQVNHGKSRNSRDCSVVWLDE
jgi:hypothetical protein